MSVLGNFQEGFADFVDNLTKAEKANINDALFESVFKVSEISTKHRVLTGVRDGNLLPIIKSDDFFGSMPGVAQNSCELADCDININYSKYSWSLGDYGCRLTLCLRKVTEDFAIFWNTYIQMLEDPLEANTYDAYLSFLMDRVKGHLAGTSWRAAYMGDKSSLNGLINKNNGFLVQLEAGGGEKFFFTQAGASPTGAEIYEDIKKAYEMRDDFDWDESNLVWRMPYKTASKLVTLFNTAKDLSQFNCECINPDSIVGARSFRVDNLKLFDIPVKAYKEIDKSQTAVNFDSPDWFLLINDNDFLIGVNATDKMEEFDVFFDKKDRSVYIDLMVRIGAGVPLDEYIFVRQDTEEEDDPTAPIED